MVSQMAKEDIETLQEEGLKPTVDDIIRLNELALMFERKKKMDSIKSLYTLPRIAQIDDSRWFRQPTLGHEIWLQSVSRYVNFQSIDTTLAVYAYALSRDYKDLPQPENMKLVIDSINDYLLTMKDYSKEQILNAIEYVQDGVDAGVDVYPEYPKSDDNNDDEKIDWNTCIAVGVLHDGLTYLHGLTISDLKHMTKREVESMVEKTLILSDKINNDAKVELANYNRTLDAIRERLQKEKDYN